MFWIKNKYLVNEYTTGISTYCFFSCHVQLYEYGDQLQIVLLTPPHFPMFLSSSLNVKPPSILSSYLAHTTCLWTIAQAAFQPGRTNRPAPEP